jgi:hypothetical protein
MVSSYDFEVSCRGLTETEEDREESLSEHSLPAMTVLKPNGNYTFRRPQWAGYGVLATGQKILGFKPGRR